MQFSTPCKHYHEHTNVHKFIRRPILISITSNFGSGAILHWFFLLFLEVPFNSLLSVLQRRKEFQFRVVEQDIPEKNHCESFKSPVLFVTLEVDKYILKPFSEDQRSKILSLNIMCDISENCSVKFPSSIIFCCHSRLKFPSRSIVQEKLCNKSSSFGWSFRKKIHSLDFVIANHVLPHFWKL